MSEWLLVVFVWSLGGELVGGKTMSGFITAQACEHRIKQDAKRVHMTYPPTKYAQVQMTCIQRDSIKPPPKEGDA